MFYVLSKTVFILAMPITWLLLALVYALFAKTAKRKNWAIGLALLYLYLASTPAIVNKLLLWWEVPPLAYSQIAQPYEVGIVLSGVVNQFKSPHDRIHIKKGADRMLHAADLYHKGLVRRLIVTGGYQQPSGELLNEAADMKAILVRCQVPDSLIAIEPLAKNTRENAIYTEKLLQGQAGPHLLITSAFHMRRSVGCFEKAGLQVHPFSTDFYTSDADAASSYTKYYPSEEAFANFYTLVHEMVGVTVYKIMGYL